MSLVSFSSLRVFVDDSFQVHHILSEIIQGGLVLETNVEEIDRSGGSHYLGFIACAWALQMFLVVRLASKARKESFASANPLSLGVGGVGSRTSGLQTPLGWLTEKLTGVGAR